MVGAETTREQTPYLPITAEDAARCREAGAAMVHMDVRTSEGKPSRDAELFRAPIRAIRPRCDLLIQTSTGGAVGVSADERCGPLTLTGPAGRTSTPRRCTSFWRTREDLPTSGLRR
jgi:3-keto-5-aminohexanoate cleavage enzyme